MLIANLIVQFLPITCVLRFGVITKPSADPDGATATPWAVV